MTLCGQAGAHDPPADAYLGNFEHQIKIACADSERPAAKCRIKIQATCQ